MASNRFGQIFTFTTWGESHGKALGVVIDGCPAGLHISEDDIYEALKKRRPGHSNYVSPRKEKDYPHILSGIYEGVTTGTPISIIIYNEDVKKQSYEVSNGILRPGHANYTYLQKYGIYDPFGGGRASARETVGRVAAGAIASVFLKTYQIELCAYLKKIGSLECGSLRSFSHEELKQKTKIDPIFCPDNMSSSMMQKLLEETKEEGDSLGGVIELLSSPLPCGLGEPIYEKLQASLAKAMLSIPACKGVFFGETFEDLEKKGSCYHDSFILKNQKIETATNRCGGILGGISTGMPLSFQVYFKPTSSIKKPIKTLSIDGQQAEYTTSEGSRHDPCVAVRAAPVVEAMTAVVLADHLLMARSSRASY